MADKDFEDFIKDQMGKTIANRVHIDVEDNKRKQWEAQQHHDEWLSVKEFGETAAELSGLHPVDKTEQTIEERNAQYIRDREIKDGEI